ncbi:MAG TPA: class I SAM-dependent methyltransferase [Spirochaetia bacterium]|nr:class I SAM-dependent methyltransferase [Spirochaetia bacterium]
MIEEDRKTYWNSYYASASRSALERDNWISKHLKLFPPRCAIIEFGCGSGGISEFLFRNGYSVTASDIAPAAVAALSLRVPELNVLQIDIAQPMSFADSSYAVAVADLCLHYFELATTKRILAEIGRILRPDGLLCARVNAANDFNYGAGVGREVEPGFFEHNGHYKRFFDRKMVEQTFSGWRLLSLDSYTLSHLSKPKNVLELIARSPSFDTTI